MNKEFVRKLQKNKRNSQITISLPKKEFPELKDKDPKFIKIKGIKFF